MADPIVGEENKVVDDAELIKEGKHPDSVSWGQYVGVKESLGKKLDTATQKVGTLEEQLKVTITKEEHDKVKGELELAKTATQKATDDLNTSKTATLTEKRATLITKGIPEEKVKDMSVEQLDGILGVIETFKPKADLSSGGGGGASLKGSPLELARQAYTKS